MTKPIRCIAASLIFASGWSLHAQATLVAKADVADASQNQAQPIHVPLTLSRTRAGTYKAIIDVGIGKLRRLPFAFDTGSTGLHVFAAARLDEAGSGVECSHEPTSVTYGNPPRITYSGVMCYATVQLGTITTAKPIAIAYLTKASCPANLPDCKIPDIGNPRAQGVYGVFGAGITGYVTGEGRAPPPILTLPAPYGQTYSLALAPQRGELILGGSAPANATAFPLTKVTASTDENWSLGRACLFVNGNPIETCMLVSFDTGNGVPWLHNVANSRLPQQNGTVTPSTRIGFGPYPNGAEAISVVAGDEFANKIRVANVAGRTMANASIQVFLNHYVTYDAVHGVISFAPMDPN